MAKRKSLSKKIRFEVFKRDKFICQYCGRHSPNVILEVDHIDPVAKGGTNDILNLITSCKDCNSGKSDVKIDDKSALAKQKKQLEELQERREQIELLLQWRKSLSDLKSDTVGLIVDYINSKIGELCLNDTGTRNIEKLTNKFEIADILDAIDISEQKYLRYDAEGQPTKESTEEFINKIGGIVALKNRPPIDKEIAYIKGICRNRFNYWNNKTGAIILNNYVTALRDFGWSEERILNDLENELKPKTIECRNWSQWKSLVEGWTRDVESWDPPNENGIEEEIIYNESELIEIAKELHKAKADVLPALQHVGLVFENFDSELLEERLTNALKYYFEGHIKTPENQKEGEPPKPSIMSAYWKSRLGQLYKPVNSGITFYLEEAAIKIFKEWLGNCQIVADDQLNSNYAKFILNEFIKIEIQTKGA